VRSLDESLREILAVNGVRVAAVVDLATGMVVSSAGDAGPDFAAAAASVADEARAARAMLGPGCPGGDLDEITLTTADRIQLARVLSARPGDGMVLFVDLDRSRINVALASLRVGQAAQAVLA
jgi:hypothetical protein